MKVRNSNIEILRLVLMVAILGWHILIYGFGLKDMESTTCISEGCFPNENMALALTSLFAPATYCFMFITGYFGMNFSLKKFMTLETCLILTALLITVLKYLFGFPVKPTQIIYSFIPVSKFTWWFMTYYMLILVISPIINNGIREISKPQFQLIILLLLAYNILSFIRLQPNGGSNFIGLFTVFGVGKYCSMYNFDISRRWAFTLFVACFALQLTAMLFCNRYFHSYLFRFLNYNTPLLMIMSISLFYGVKNMKARSNKRINFILRPTLFIYLITDGIQEPFYQWLVSIANGQLLTGCIYIVFTITICLILGHLIMILAEKIVTTISQIIQPKHSST